MIRTRERSDHLTLRATERQGTLKTEDDTTEGDCLERDAESKDLQSVITNLTFGQHTVPRHPKGPKAAQKPVGRTRTEAREELRRRWQKTPERRALLVIAWWITRQMPHIETARAVEQARQRLATKVGVVTTTNMRGKFRSR